ncbi:MAG: hypothetical protein R3B57_03680 [Phycisphaerales bacterium]
MIDGLDKAPPYQRPRPWLSLLLAAGVAIVFGLVGVGVGVYVALVRGGVVNPAWNPANIARSRAHADLVIAALGQYYADHGVYPELLDDLSPNYLANLPAPTAGIDHWIYASTDAGREFVLQFSANRYDDPTSWYDSRHDGWFIQEHEVVEGDDPQPDLPESASPQP